MGPRKGDWDKTLFKGKANFMKFVLTLDKLGMDFLPDSLKQLVALLILLGPILLSLAIIKHTKESPEPAQAKQPQQEEKPRVISKRRR